MTKRHTIAAWATALAALAIVGLLAGCTIYRFGPESPAAPLGDPNIGQPVVGPDREQRLPAVQVCFLQAGVDGTSQKATSSL